MCDSVSFNFIARDVAKQGVSKFHVLSQSLMITQVRGYLAHYDLTKIRIINHD